MSTIEATTIPEVPPKDETTAPATINVEEQHQEATAPVTTDDATTTKVTPVQRINSVLNKAKKTLTDVYSDAQKAITEKKTPTAAADAPQVEEAAAPTTTNKTTTDNKNLGATATAAFKDIFNRLKVNKALINQIVQIERLIYVYLSCRGLSLLLLPQEQLQLVSLLLLHTKQQDLFFFTNISKILLEPAVEQEAGEGEEAPAPPPKDSHNKSTTTNPVVDQLKRNTTLLSNYILQKKKEFTEKKSSASSTDNEQQQQAAATPEVHDETGNIV